MNSVRLYYIKHQGEYDLTQIDTVTVNNWMADLATQKQAAVRRLINEGDRITSLLGLQLLKQCARDEQLADFHLRDVYYPENSKPLWQSDANESFDFNISHSEDLIMIAASRYVRVGIDAEKIRSLKRLNFKMVMLPEELNRIKQTPKLFFELWSKKEAVVKAADTSGLSRMRDVILDGNNAMLDDKNWYLQEITLPDLQQYAVHLAVSDKIQNLIVKQINLSECVNDI